MKTNTILGIVLSCCFLCDSATAADADALYNQGIEHLKLANKGDATKIVPAAQSFAMASILYERLKDVDGVLQANSCLYWCKKRMTVADSAAYAKGEAQLTARMKAVQVAVPKYKAQAYFDNAKEFAKSNPDKHLLIAIRFYEIADRFAGMPVSLEALRRSLDAIQRVSESRQAARPPAEKTKSPAPVQGETFPADDIRNHAAVKTALASFTKSTSRAETPYLKKLESAKSYARRQGKLEEFNRIKEEVALVSESKGEQSSRRFTSRSLAYAQKSYNSVVMRARAKLIKDLGTAMKAELRKGNDAAAQAIDAFKKKQMRWIYARYIRISLPGPEHPLSLAEVQVFSGGRNVAQKGKASQSTTLSRAVASLAIDGNTNGVFRVGSISHTKEVNTIPPNSIPWWELDLKTAYPIEKIVVWNRVETIPDHRLNGFHLQAMDAARTTVFEYRPKLYEQASYPIQTFGNK